MHELFEHTADLGLRIRSRDLNTLFEEAGLCLMSAMIEDIESIRPREELRINLAGEELDYLLFDWLRELLLRFETERLLFSKFSVEITASGFQGRAWGEPNDPDRHILTHEVKAITYHGLKVENSDDGWLAEVIVDI
jgi:SHS2 domain-containing protein